MNSKQHAFTLIELLVVIAIIALLTAILMPALNVAKQQAGSAVCLMNEKQLVLAWMMYAENNDYIMCGPMTGITGSPRYDWVGPPRDQRDHGMLLMRTGTGGRAGATSGVGRSSSWSASSPPCF